MSEKYWLYANVEPEKLETTTDDLVIEVAHSSATSTMLEKVKHIQTISRDCSVTRCAA